MNTQTERRLSAIESKMNRNQSDMPQYDLSALNSDELEVLKAHALTIEKVIGLGGLVYMTGSVVSMYSREFDRDSADISGQWLEETYKSAMAKAVVLKPSEGLQPIYIYGPEADL